MKSLLSSVLLVAAVAALTIPTAGHDQTTPATPTGRELRIAEGGDSSSPSDSGPKDRAEWQQLVVEELVRQRRFPPGSAHRNEHGVATVLFKVDRTGRVIEQKLVKTSGFFALDLEAMELIKRAQLPPFAATMTESELQLTVPIRFAGEVASNQVAPTKRWHWLFAASTAFLTSALILALVFAFA